MLMLDICAKVRGSKKSTFLEYCNYTALQATTLFFHTNNKSLNLLSDLKYKLHKYALSILFASALYFMTLRIL